MGVLRQPGRLLACLVALAALTACESAADPSEMAVHDLLHPAIRHGSVAVSVDGGTNGWINVIRGHIAHITSADFKTAVTESLRNSGLFKSVSASNDPTYQLNATLEDLAAPLSGLDMTAYLTVDWALSRTADHKVLWHELIHSKATATLGDAFAGLHRARIADERAARQNIERALSGLATARF